MPENRAAKRQIGRGVPLEPIEFDVEAWFARLNRYADVPFMENGREQPPMPEDDVSFD